MNKICTLVNNTESLYTVYFLGVVCVCVFLQCSISSSQNWIRSFKSHSKNFFKSLR